MGRASHPTTSWTSFTPTEKRHLGRGRRLSPLDDAPTLGPAEQVQWAASDALISEGLQWREPVHPKWACSNPHSIRNRVPDSPVPGHPI